ncbi:MAG TPA: glycosyltransferase [Thermoleophilaceae bacterium]|nr:glycosyltransferase [Thermoleophilaceae bacterium]
MTTTILLISTDRAAELRHSLPAALAQEDAEVVVIDNASDDETPDIASSLGAGHLRLPRRVSWAAANNAGIAAAEGDSVLLLNADCFLEPDFLSHARARLAEPGVGAVAPKLVRTLGPEAGDRLDLLDAAGIRMTRTRSNNLVGHGRPRLAYDTPGLAFGADGAAALYRREMLADCAVEGEVLDPAFEKWASDVDLAWRGHLMGWKCAYEPRAVAYHVRSYGPSSRASVPEADRRVQFRNRYLMMLKNDSPASFTGDLPRVAGYEVLALGYAILRERHLLPGYREAFELAPAARRKGRLIARMRTADPRTVPFGLEPAP